MSWLSILYLLASFFIISIGTIVFLNNYKNPINRSFFLVCLSTFIWQFFYAFMLNNNFGMGLLFAKIGHFAVPYVPVTLLHYTIRTLNIKRINIILRLLYLEAMIMSLLVFSSSLHFSKLIKHPWGVYPKGEILMFVDFTICCLIAGSFLSVIIYHYIKKRKSVNIFELNRLKYIFISVFIFALAIIDYIPKLPKIESDAIPLGNIFIIIFVSLNSYAILKYRLFDINIVIRKGVIYSLLVTIITLIYFTLIFLLENIFRGFVGYKSTLLTIVVIIIFIFIFQPLKNKIQYLVDKYFFKGSIDQIEQENIRLREELQRSEKLKVVGTFAAGMAHEIKNPLTSIKTFTEYLPKKYHDKKFVDKFERIVGSEVNKIDNIVGQLLDFAKPRPLEIKKSNIRKLMDETLEFLSNDFIKYRINVIKNYAISPTLKIDPVQIKQVFLNIILNAIESMKEKGGKLIMDIKESEPNLTEISIEDTGYGINKKDLKHLFDPFFTTKETNTGLGLSIVHGIIEKHKGKIKVDSQLGKGTKFTLLLPDT